MRVDAFIEMVVSPLKVRLKAIPYHRTIRVQAQQRLLACNESPWVINAVTLPTSTTPYPCVQHYREWANPYVLEATPSRREGKGVCHLWSSGSIPSEGEFSKITIFLIFKSFERENILGQIAGIHCFRSAFMKFLEVSFVSVRLCSCMTS